MTLALLMYPQEGKSSNVPVSVAAPSSTWA
jgi:hypothetical protein